MRFPPPHPGFVFSTHALLAYQADGVPAVVVSFGLTPRERLAAEEAVFRGGPTFPTGVRFVDGSAAAQHDGSSTIRKVRGSASRASSVHEAGAVPVIHRRWVTILVP